MKLADRFETLGRTRSPDLWPDISRREPRLLPPEAPPGPRLVAAAVALILATAGIGVAIRAFRSGEPPDKPATVIENGKIAFTGGAEIYVIGPDGMGLTNLTNTPNRVGEYAPAWSPDGTRIAFTGYVDDPELSGANYDLFVMNADGTGRLNLTTSDADIRDAASQGDPSWSPDGSRIVFDSDSREGSGIFVIDADGSGLTLLDGGVTGANLGPAWSPDGTVIAYVQNVEGPDGYDIFTTNLNGADKAVLTTNPGFDGYPAWSPDGTRIAFVSDRDGGLQAYVMDAAGTHQTKLTEIPSDGTNCCLSGHLDWSPDGTRIAFEAWDQERGDFGIWAVNADGTGQVKLTNDLGDEAAPIWSPDGSKIAFEASPVPSSDRENTGTFDVYVMNPDGTGVTRLTSGMFAAGGGLSWQPVPVLADAPDVSPTPTDPPVRGSIALVHGNELPEGRLLVQIDDHVELLEEGAPTSTLLGQALVALDLSPDGSRTLVTEPFESGGADTPLLSIDLDTGERMLISDVKGWSFPALWSPDGSKVAYRVGEPHTLCIRDLAIGEPRCLPELGRIYTFDWSPDGTRLVFEQDPPGSLIVLDVVTGETTVMARWDGLVVLDTIREAGLGLPVSIQFQGPRWSPSGRYVAALAMVRTEQGHSGEVVLVFDLEGRVVAAGQPSGEFSEARGWSPTADVFAYATGEPPYQIVEARLLDVSTGQDRLLVSTANVGRETIRSMAWSPGGRWVAVGVISSQDGTFFSEIRVLDTTGADPPRVFQSFAVAELVDWGP